MFVEHMWATFCGADAGSWSLISSHLCVGDDLRLPHPLTNWQGQLVALSCRPPLRQASKLSAMSNFAGVSVVASALLRAPPQQEPSRACARPPAALVQGRRGREAGISMEKEVAGRAKGEGRR